MASPSANQGQEIYRVLVLSDQGTGMPTPNVQCIRSHCVDALVTINCQNPAELVRNSSDLFPSSCFIPGDIEKGAIKIPKINHETSGTIKTEISLTKSLQRQISVHTGGEYIPTLMDDLPMLLKFDSRGKHVLEQTDNANNKWRKSKRAASFDARQIVLLFSILSSMGTIVLIFLTLRVRQVSNGYLHGPFH